MYYYIIIYILSNILLLNIIIIYYLYNNICFISILIFYEYHKFSVCSKCIMVARESHVILSTSVFSNHFPS
jgi:hypothetical protein